MSSIPESASKYRSTKSYHNYPCAHRQWRHDGLCRQVHGYSRSFHFEFGAKELNVCGWVVDFGDLKGVKQYLDYMFDHTLLIMRDDPQHDLFVRLEDVGACALRHIDYGVGMEGTARHLCEWVDTYIRRATNGRCWVIKCEARENEKNSAIYFNPGAGYKEML